MVDLRIEIKKSNVTIYLFIYNVNRVWCRLMHLTQMHYQTVCSVQTISVFEAQCVKCISLYWSECVQ